MTSLRSALFLDFDNVFSGLLGIDRAAAVRLAEQPDVWLERLRQGGQGRPSRRWLVLRSYLNPQGSVSDPAQAGSRLHFSKFRKSFTDASFHVVDCPRVAHTKNAADIQLVIDALDALQVEPRYDEIVLMSGDSDMTPLVVRLRALDRRVTVISPSEPTPAMRSAADQVISGEDLLRLLRPQAADAEHRFRSLVVSRYAATPGPINLATLANEVHDEIGPVVRESRWFGHKQFLTAVQSLELPDLRLSQDFMWDASRHDAPPTGRANLTSTTDVIGRLRRAVKLPLLPAEVWRSIYAVLANFARSHEFSISEATQWSRDQLAADGTEVSRQIIGTVMRGAASAGCPLYRQPLPEADEIGTAFVRSVLERADTAGLGLSDAEEAQARTRLGVRDENRGERAG